MPICATLLLQASPAQMGTLAAVGSLPVLLFSLPPGAIALAERLGVRGGLAVVSAGARLLTPTTLFGTRLHRIRQ